MKKVFYLKVLLLWWCSNVFYNLHAQNPDKFIPEKTGTSKIVSNLSQYSGGERVAFEKSLFGVADWMMKNNEVLAQKKGFDLKVWYFGMYDDYYKLRPCNYGLISEMRFDFELFIRENGKETKWTIEPPNYKVFINSTEHGSGRFQQEEHFDELKDDPAIKIPLNKVLGDLSDLRVVFPLEKEIAPGVRLYGDGNLVVFNPARAAYWIPVTLRQVAEMKKTALTLRKDEFLLPQLLKEIASLSEDEMNAAACQGDDNNFVLNANGKQQGLQIMRFNKDYWNRTLPKTAVQFITLYYKPQSNEEKAEFLRDNGCPAYSRLTAEAMKLNELESLIDKK